MAFNQAQTRTVRVVVVSLALIAVIVLAVAVVGGGMLSAQSAQASDAAVQQQGDGAPTASGSDAASADEVTMEQVDAQYTQATDALQEQYDADPDNPSALLNLANGYFDWGAAARGYATTEDDDYHVVHLFSQAIAHYDDYLERYGTDDGANKSVQVDRAIAIFYTGDVDTAVSTLEAFVAQTDDFGPAWANLGMFYESQGRIDDARSAYERAVSSDTDNSYGVKDYAQARLDALNSATAQGDGATSDSNS